MSSVGWRLFSGILLVLIFLPEEVGSSHFRGAFITWKPGEKENEVLISYRVSWRRSYSWSLRCTDNDIKNGHQFQGEGPLYFYDGSSGRSFLSVNGQFFCTDFDTSEDWVTGEKVNIKYEASRTFFYLGFQGSAWINLQVNGGGDWRVLTTVNLTKRHDNGRINSSPVTNTAPIVRIQQNCYHAINIKVIDPDYDIVRCRFAEEYSYCGSICNGLPNAVLDEQRCIIYYNATGSAGLYGVAIVLEDYIYPTDTEPMSRVSVQFLLDVFAMNEGNCTNQEAMFSRFTRTDGACVGVPINSTYVERFYAATTENEPIQSFTTSSPLGMIKSAVTRSNGTSFLPRNFDWYFIEVQWPVSATISQSFVFCFSAVATSGILTEQRCITLVVGAKPPEIVPSSLVPAPGSSALPNLKQFQMQFNEKIVRPTRAAFFNVYKANHLLVYSLDVSGALNYDIDSNNVVTVTVDNRLRLDERETYYVHLTHGFVRNTRDCGIQSTAVTDTAFWNFTIKDITSPTGSFLERPGRTNSSATLAWTFNEQATSRCVLRTPKPTVQQISCEGNKWEASGLEEGRYTLNVYGTDEAGNTDLSASHTWIVDTTPPIIKLHNARKVYNTKQVNFYYNCPYEFCTFTCVLFLNDVRIVAQTACGHASNGHFNAGGLKSEEEYMLQINAVDVVGNVAVLSYNWTTDFTAPVIFNIGNITVECGKSISPDALSFPSVSDAVDKHPSLRSSDEQLENCALKRTWTATDEAGNQATRDQFIFIANPQPIQVVLPAHDLVACSDDLPQSVDINEMIRLGAVHHPCNRTVVYAVKDVPVITACDMTTSRQFTFTDNCGQTTVFTQNLKVLPLDLPGQPKNGEIGVDLQDTLKWPSYPNTLYYLLFVWKHGEAKGPGVQLTHRFYRPSERFPSNTKMLWQVKYVLKPGFAVNNVTSVPSPVWGFETAKVADFKVGVVNVPNEAFTGRSFEVTWTVTNVGTGMNIQRHWYDYVFISTQETAVRGQLSRYVRREDILFPADAYTAKTTLDIPHNLPVGKYFVHVISNFNDIDRQNNAGQSQQVAIKLTPPPDLQLESIVVPTTSFSGKTVEIRWKVTNKGYGATDAESWYDTVYWLPENSTLDNNAKLLTRISHQGRLFPFADYTVKTDVSVPKYIKGNFQVAVVTDSLQQVYEHLAENNNVLMSETISVLLSPPADLAVVSVVTAGSVSSEDDIVVTYTVKNEGSGPSDVFWWYDQVLIESADKSTSQYMRRAHSGDLQPLANYTNNLVYTIPVEWPSGDYHVSVYTDPFNRVFESKFTTNNFRSTNFTVVQRVPDLQANTFDYNMTLDKQTGKFFVEFSSTITNKGNGQSSESEAWLFLSYGAQSKEAINSFALKALDVEEVFSLTGNLSVNRRSQKDSSSFIFTIHVNYKEDVFENDYSNNAFQSKPFAPPKYLDDVDISLQLRAGNVYAESVVEVVAQYTNKMNYPTVGGWKDELWLDHMQQQTFLMAVESPPLNTTVKREFSVIIPKEVFGLAKIVFKNDVGLDLLKNVVRPEKELMVYVDVPPSADLKPVWIQVQFVGNNLKVEWSVINQGNSMLRVIEWFDSIVASSSRDNPYASGWFLMDVYTTKSRMQTYQRYRKSALVSFPSKAKGSYYIHLIVDSKDSVKELKGETNNVLYSAIPYQVPTVPSSDLQATIDGFDMTVRAGQFGSVNYTVVNGLNITTSASSWLDEVTLELKNGERIVLGIYRRYGALSTNETYANSIKLFYPHFIEEGNYTIHLQTDKNGEVSEVNRLNNWASSSTHIARTLSVDLSVTIKSQNISGFPGQPLTIDYIITNLGPARLSSLFSWFDSLYLSYDTLLDPFDTNLNSKSQHLNIAINQSSQFTFDFTLPFNLVAGNYYLLISIDKSGVLNEETTSNNIAHMLLINEATSFVSDIAVSDVVASPQVTYGDNVDANWKIVNNGTEKAVGYKCDTLYFSEDRSWDVFDTELSKSCSLLSLNSARMQNEATSVKAPLVRQAEFHSIVKSRSSITDFNHTNNIAVSKSTTFVAHHNLTIEVEQAVNADKNKHIFHIGDVSSGETLIVFATINDQTTNVDVYLKYDHPPTTGNFDAHSGSRISPKKRCLIKNTKKGSYYVLVVSPKNSGKTLNLLAKIAKPEIIDVFPAISPPAMRTTFKIQGTLLPYDYTFLAYSTLQNFTVAQVHRLSSDVMFLTLSLENGSLDELITLVLIDTNTNETITKPDAIKIDTGIATGSLLVVVDSPNAVRVGELAEVNINVQNNGGSDVASPLFYVQINGDDVSMEVDGKIAQSNKKLIIVSPDQSPAGNFPPGSSVTAILRVMRDTEGQASYPVQVSQLRVDDEHHPYFDMKDMFRPLYFTEERWQPVWQNFLQAVGETRKSFHKRITQTAETLSLSGERILSVEELVRFELHLADGFLAGDALHRSVDVEAEGDEYPFLNVERFYKAQLSYRNFPIEYNGYGPFGRGWISPLWSLKIINVTAGYIILRKNGDFHYFLRNEEQANFENKDGIGTIHLNETRGEYVFKDEQADGITYTFNQTSFQLTTLQQGGSVITNVEYGRMYDNRGNSINIFYNDQRFINSLQLYKNKVLVDHVNYEYNQLNQLISTQDKAGTVTRYEYTETHAGLLRVISTPVTTRYFYNTISGLYIGFEKRLTENGHLLRSDRYEPRAAGVFERLEEPGDKRTLLRFNTEGQLVESTSLGQPPTRVMRSADRTTILTDDAVVATEVFDKTNNIKRVTNGAGDTTEMHFLPNGVSLNKLVDAAGNPYTADYDANGMLVKNTYPDELTEAFEYDNNGYLSKIVKRSNDALTFDRDSEGFLFRKTINGNEYTDLKYKDGLLVEAVSENSRVEITYNNLRRPTSVTYDKQTTLTYTYDEYGRRSSIADSSGAYNVSYEYNARGRVTQVKRHGASILTVDYYEDGRVKKRSHGDGSNVDYQYVKRKGVSTDKLSSLTSFDKDGKNLRGLKYSYDRFARLSKMIDDNTVWKYTYGSNSQLSSFKRNDKLTEYDYDNTLNRKTKDDSRTETSYTYNNLNQLKRAGEEHVYYDKRGNVKRIENLRAAEVQQFEFTVEDKLKSSSGLTKCMYSYDALGNVKSKQCDDKPLVEYLIDPFGMFGRDILSEKSADTETHYYHGIEQGLICKDIQPDNVIVYYHFNQLGSTLHTTENGLIVDSYNYDPFGGLIYHTKNRENRFLFVGQYGVERLDGFSPMFHDVYLMRNRLYHSQHARFMSLDPYGFQGKSTNLYTYMANNPLAGVDPKGTILPLALVGAGALIGSVTNSVIYAATSGSDFSFGGLGNAAVSGAVGGAGAVVTAALMPAAGIMAAGAAGLTVGAISGTAGTLTEQAINGKFDGGAVLESAIVGGITGLIPFKMYGYKGQGFTGFGNIKNGLIRNMKFNKILRGLNTHGKALWKNQIASSVVGNAIGKAYNAVKKYSEKIGNDVKKLYERASKLAGKTVDRLHKKGKEIAREIRELIRDTVDTAKDLSKQAKEVIGEELRKAADWVDETLDNMMDALQDMWNGIERDGKQLYNDFIRWVQSLDPNDIIGPKGFGDAHFISPSILLRYTIRFENHVNATAPAQRVLVTQQLDEDIDPRTFRVHEVGFGNHTFPLKSPSSLLQESFEVSDTYLVRTIGGVDIETSDVTFQLETIDLNTGERPEDPSVGFLPPNPVNRTEGQGYIVYTARAKQNTPSLSVIDAKASIIFDENEPIATPPIFNTIDGEPPLVNISHVGVTLTLTKFDNGSGANYVDVYHKNNASSLVLLAEGVTSNTVAMSRDTVAMARDVTLEIYTRVFDHVGNSRLSPVPYTFTIQSADCSGVRNCSGNGVCAGNDLCSCHEEKFGDDCSKDVEPVQPPVLSVNATLNLTSKIRHVPLYVHRVSCLSCVVDVTLKGLPSFVSLDVGERNASEVWLNEMEARNVSFTWPDHMTMFNFTMETVARQQNEDGETAERSLLTKVFMKDVIPTQPPVKPTTQPPVKPATQPPVKPTTQPPVKPTTQPPETTKSSSGVILWPIEMVFLTIVTFLHLLM